MFHVVMRTVLPPGGRILRRRLHVEGVHVAQAEVMVTLTGRMIQGAIGDADGVCRARVARGRILAGMAALAVALATTANAQTTASTSSPGADPTATGGANMKPSQQVGTPAQPASSSMTAVLEPGDLVRLKIWREPDLSGDFSVDDRGTAVFPKIGPVHVSEMSTDSLRKMLLATYSTYLRDPAIEITMLRRVNVLGAVTRPGLYPVDPTMSVTDVLALAGGATPNGNQKKLELIRNGQRVPVDFSMRTPVGETPIRSGDQLYLPERSWLSRNGYVVGALIGASAVVGTVIITHK
jgi:protein involved in polysaccharide export with SLBB domain